MYIKLPAANVKTLNAIMSNQDFSEDLISEVQIAVVTDMIAAITGNFVMFEDSFFDDTAVMEIELDSLPTLEKSKAHFSDFRQSFEAEVIACNDENKIAISKPIEEWNKALVEQYIYAIVLFSVSDKEQLVTDPELEEILLRKIIERLAVWEY